MSAIESIEADIAKLRDQIAHSERELLNQTAILEGIEDMTDELKRYESALSILRGKPKVDRKPRAKRGSAIAVVKKIIEANPKASADTILEIAVEQGGGLTRKALARALREVRNNQPEEEGVLS